MTIKDKILLSSVKMVREELKEKGLCWFALPIAEKKQKQLNDLLGYKTKVVNNYLLKKLRK